MFEMEVTMKNLLCCILSFGLIACEEATQALFECTTAECVDVAIAHGADVHAVNSEGMTPLLWAANAGHTGAVNALIAAGADVDSSNMWGSTALMHAVRENHIPVLETLIANGADATVFNEWGYNALMWAAIHDSLEALHVLLATDGVDVNAARSNGETAYYLARERGHVRIMEALRDVGAVPTSSFSIDRTHSIRQIRQSESQSEDYEDYTRRDPLL